jgi:HK97 family phage major capsid protein
MGGFFMLLARKKKLLSEREQARKQLVAIHEVAESEDRDLTEDEGVAAQGAADLIKQYDARILRIEETLAITTTDPAQCQIDGLTIGGPSRISNPTPVIESDPKRGFKTLGEFGMSVYSASVPQGYHDQRLQMLAAASGASMGVGSDGGWLIPPAFSTQVWDGLNDPANSLLPLTDSYTVTGESLTFNASAETSRVAGSRWGGIRGYWIAEADQMTASKPKLRQLKLEPQQLAVMCYATDKLLKNAQAVEQWLTRAAVDEINFLVGDSIINGTGAGQPQGILNGTCLIPVAKETNQAAASIVYANVVKMYQRLHARSRAGARWYINQDCEPSLQQMSLTVGAGGVPAYLPPGGLSVSPYSTLMGLPVVPLEYCPTLGTVGDILLADMKAYATGLRGGVESAMSMHLRFDYNETAFRFLFEVDGQPWLASPITPYKGTNTTSPFVALATRS